MGEEPSSLFKPFHAPPVAQITTRSAGSQTKDSLQMSNSSSNFEDAFDQLGLSLEEVEAFQLAKRAKKVANSEVCACGHAMNKHTQYESGHWDCHTAKMWCPCQEPIPVLVADDTKYFMTKTHGYGAKHALATGLLRCRQKGVKTRMIVEPICFKCERETDNLFPAAINRENRLVDVPADRNGIFCIECIYAFQGIQVEIA